jgi:hypothetical protein
MEYGGGSLLLFIGRQQHSNIRQPDNRRIVEQFMERTQKNLLSFSALVSTLKKKGQGLSFFGAGARGVSMLQLSGRGKEFNYVLDDNPGKQGLYIPGCQLPIVPVSDINRSMVDYCFLSPLNSKAAERAVVSRLLKYSIHVVEFFPGDFQEPSAFFHVHEPSNLKRRTYP